VEGSSPVGITGAPASEVGVGVIVAKITDVGVATDGCGVGVGSTLMTKPITMLSTMIRLSTYRITWDVETRRFEDDLLLLFRRVIMLLQIGFIALRDYTMLAG
jgi:hypothetical protein